MSADRSHPVSPIGVDDLAAHALFVVSGAVGLLYEILWLRKLALIFGSSAQAVSAVLSIFFAGLALGGWLFGRLIDRRPADGLRWYAACEAVIGVYALATPWFFALLSRVPASLYRVSGYSSGVLTLAALVSSTVVLLLPATLMGASLPLMTAAVCARQRARGPSTASLYAANTFGAMAGTVFAYTIALQRLGWLTSLRCAGLVNLLLAICARALDRRWQASDAPARSASAPRAPARSSADEQLVPWIMAAMACSGFSAMACEVGWTRGLSLTLGSSTYAFCVILATFLAGTAIGSAVAQRVLRRHRLGPGTFAALEVAIGFSTLLGIPCFAKLPEWFLRLWPVFGGTFVGYSWLQVVLSASIMLVPTMLMGFAFPVACELVTASAANPSQRLGSLYAVNTLGGIAGSLAAGFWLLPSVGAAEALACAALVQVAAGLLIRQRSVPGFSRIRAALSIVGIAAVIVLAQTIIVPSWQREMVTSGAYLDPTALRPDTVEQNAKKWPLLFYRDGLNATVSVHGSLATGQLYLKVGGKTDASTGIDMSTQILAAHIPLLLHPHPSRVMVVGLGSGVTLGSAGLHPMVTTLDCAELEQAVVDGARFFKAQNQHVHDDPRAHIFVADGRNVLMARPERYDVIISEPSNPWMAGVANLYTEEYFTLCREQLERGGIMAMWMQLYRLYPEDARLIFSTFQRVFPYVSLWSTIEGDSLLIGTMEPHGLRYGQLVERMSQPAIAADLRRIEISDARVFLESFLLGSDDVRRFTAGETWVHRDDLPLLEFNAPRSLHAGPMLRVNFNGLSRFRSPVTTICPDAPDVSRDAGFYANVGRYHHWRMETDSAIDAFEHAVAIDPSSADAQTQLGELYARRGRILGAEEAFKRAHQARPDAREPLQQLARLEMTQRRMGHALAIYDALARMRAPDAALGEEIGAAYLLAAHPLIAAEYLRSAVSQAPVLGAPLAESFSRALVALQQWSSAEAVLRLATSTNPDTIPLSLLLATTLREQGKRSEAQALLGRVVLRAPTSVDAHVGLAEMAAEQGDERQAMSHAAAALRYDPYQPTAHELLARLAGRAAHQP